MNIDRKFLSFNTKRIIFKDKEKNLVLDIFLRFSLGKKSQDVWPRGWNFNTLTSMASGERERWKPFSYQIVFFTIHPHFPLNSYKKTSCSFSSTLYFNPRLKIYYPCQRFFLYNSLLAFSQPFGLPLEKTVGVGKCEGGKWP